MTWLDSLEVRAQRSESGTLRRRSGTQISISMVKLDPFSASRLPPPSRPRSEANTRGLPRFRFAVAFSRAVHLLGYLLSGIRIHNLVPNSCNSLELRLGV